MLFSKIIEKKFAAVLGRYEGNKAIPYPEMQDFPGLKRESFDIQGDKNVCLRGAFYYYGEMKNDRLLIFDHGIGAGHMAYLTEINCLAGAGYSVYSYDHTGCAESGGEGILGFAQGINDLYRVCTALLSDSRFKDSPLKLAGHSWGGYSAMNTAALVPQVSHVVSIAGFLSARALIEQYIPKPFLKYSEEVMDRERQHNPDYADMNAVDSLKKSSAKLLFLQSEDDSMVKFSLAAQPLREALKDRENTEFIISSGRDHDPHKCPEAAAAFAKMQQEIKALGKKSSEEQIEKFRSAQDKELLFRQDTEVWEKIFAFLEN